tara:strand:- start:190 stop:543 length:354 start_codon:yes stop_codon:yes gene_type:complete
MVCIISNIGRNIVSNNLLLEAAMPNGIPITIQKITAVNIMAKVVIVSFHRSTRSIAIKLRAAKKANFNPLVFHEKKIKIRITIGKGIQLNNVSNPSRVASMGAANFLKSGRCVNNHS